METEVSVSSYLCFHFFWQCSVQLPDIPSYYFTDDEIQYYDFDDDLDDLEIDVVTDLGSFIVFELIGFHAVLLVVDIIMFNVSL